MKTSTKILLGTIVGTAIGITAGILLTPNQHKSTAEQSEQPKGDLSNKIQQSVDRMNALTMSAFQLINDYKQKLRRETQQENVVINNQDNTY